jgi:hypothetical protein
MAGLQLFEGMVTHTPLWVFAVFALLVYLGLQATRPRTLGLRRILIVPAIFIAWGIVSLVSAHAVSTLLIGDWIVAAALGAGLASAMVRFPALRADRGRRKVHLPGSALPLIRNLAIFGAKYGLAVAAAMTPAARDHLALWDIAVSGLSAGYFLGWLGRFAAAYRHAPGFATASDAFLEGGIP